MPSFNHIGLGYASTIGLVGVARSRRMPTKSVTGEHYHSVVATNLRTLIAHETGGSVSAWAQRYKLNQSTVNRIANGTMDPTVSKLAELLENSNYQPWQLMHPDFNPRSMPPLGDARAMRVAAIFGSISSELDKRRAEAIMEQFSAD